MRVPNYIEVETSRYCNRLCGWCPNSSLRNRRSQELLPWAFLEKIISSLRRAQYQGWFAFHNYNEPLENPRLSDELRLVHRHLPNAQLTIYTNGDKLTPALFDDLVFGGLCQMRITIYPKNDLSSDPSNTRLWAWLKRHCFLQNLEWAQVALRQGSALVHQGPPELILIYPNVSRYYDRGGTIPSLSLLDRTRPCFLTSNSLSIDYLGNIKMCCNIVTGHAPHEAYIMGNVSRDDIIDVWNSCEFEEIRERHLRADWSNTPICRTCRQELK